jgi:general secretion pathway protein D
MNRALICTLALLAGCAATPVQRASDLLRAGQPDAALVLLDQAVRNDTLDPATRALQARARTAAVQRWLGEAERLRMAGRAPDAQLAVQRALALEPSNARAAALARDITRDQRQAALLVRAQAALRDADPAEARRLAEQVLLESPTHGAARALLYRLRPAPVLDATPPALADAYRKPVTLEFRDAPLRNVFEALARGTQLNFVFDKEVRGDTKVSLALRDVPLDEALRLVLNTQQLDRKTLNANTLLIYPDTQAKQRQHQDLVTRTLYLTNADPKSVLTMIRTIAKTQDVYVDERLNALIVRDTPGVVRLIEDLVATVDLPEPEVMLEVEVLEVATARLDALGLEWPEQVSVGLVSADGVDTAPGQIVLSRDTRLRASISNPALVATLRGSDGTTNTLANPSIRARNREKAQVHVGEKLPVFTTTSTANVGVSASVAYLDVGIKLDVEPIVQLDNEVTIKVGLEVSNLVRQVAGPAGSVAYQIGTRRTSTSLRLKDGETQILAGLINDEDRQSANGVPGLSGLPVIGRLFGVHTDNRSKTEVVLLITPHVLRNLPLPDPQLTLRAGGTAADPGAAPLRLSAFARAGAGPASAGPASAAAPAIPAAAPRGLQLTSSGRVAPGGTVSVTLVNHSDLSVSGELEFDPALLRNAAAGAPEGPRTPFEIAPGGEFVLVLRALASAPVGTSTQVQVGSLAAIGRDGVAAVVEVGGEATIEVQRER